MADAAWHQAIANRDYLAKIDARLKKIEQCLWGTTSPSMNALGELRIVRIRCGHPGCGWRSGNGLDLMTQAIPAYLTHVTFEHGIAGPIYLDLSSGEFVKIERTQKE